MATPHINANYGDFAKVVLMPGDPRRATYIAENFLTDVKLVSDVRGMLGYTGLTKNGKRISVMTSGMGMPSIGIVANELYNSYGVETIIRVGTCGSYNDNINLKDIIIAMGASTDSNFLGQLNLPGTYSAIATYEILEKAVVAAKENKVNYSVGNILSADVFYDFEPDTYKKWKKMGILGVEMESYALYSIASYLNKKALCILTVTDHFEKPEKLTSKEREIGLREMLEVAIKTGEAFLE